MMNAAALLLCLFSVFIMQSFARDYKYLDYASMVDKIYELERKYPQQIKVTTAQEEYGLDSPGKCGPVDCEQHIIHLTNFQTYFRDKTTRPEVFFSGAVHGNERVGPTTLIETLELLARNHAEGDNPWLKRLVDTRSIFMMPAANAIGYFKNECREGGIDPNRDFAFDREDQDCMNTITARAINEIWRDHMFQLALTFHSGVRMIGYMWGDITNGDNFTSPDQYAQASIAAALSAYAGTFDEISNPSPDYGDPELYNRYTYPNGPRTDLLYAVNGGMEDWAYAASWAPQQNVCKPQTNPDYPEAKTIYDDAMMRTLNILIESDDDSTPSEDTLGSTFELLKASGVGQGHLPRHIRLTLMTIEAVQPYIKYVGFTLEPSDSKCAVIDSRSDFTTEMVEFDDINGGYITRSVDINENMALSYEIGGSFKVASTYLSVFKKPASFTVGEITPQIMKELEPFKQFDTPVLGGYTRWGGGGLYGSSESTKDQNIFADYTELKLATFEEIDDREKFPFIPAWKSCFTAPEEAGEYIIIAQAVVDAEWGETPLNSTPKNIEPQSHVVQARTNTEWRKSNNNFMVQGQVNWFSSPFLLVVNEVDETSNEDEPKTDALLISMSSVAGCLVLVLLITTLRTAYKRRRNVVPHYISKEDKIAYRASL